MSRKGLSHFTFESKIVNTAPEQPGVFAIFAADGAHLATHFANANLRGAIRREATNHPEALESGWFFVLRVEPDADSRRDLLAQWQASPETILLP
jgi:hypothetical protein